MLFDVLKDAAVAHRPQGLNFTDLPGGLGRVGQPPAARVRTTNPPRRARSGGEQRRTSSARRAAGIPTAGFLGPRAGRPVLRPVERRPQVRELASTMAAARAGPRQGIAGQAVGQGQVGHDAIAGTRAAAARRTRAAPQISSWHRRRSRPAPSGARQRVQNPERPPADALVRSSRPRRARKTSDAAPRRPRVAHGECRLAGPGSTDEDHQLGDRQREPHRRMMAYWWRDGAPRWRAAEGEPATHGWRPSPKGGSTMTFRSWPGTRDRDLGVAVQSKFLAVGAVVPWGGLVPSRPSRSPVAWSDKTGVARARFDGACTPGLVSRCARTAPGRWPTHTVSRPSHRPGCRVPRPDRRRLRGAGQHRRARVVDARRHLPGRRAAVSGALVACPRRPDAAGGDRRGRQSASLLVVRDGPATGAATTLDRPARGHDHPDPIASSPGSSS
jgi:hypothetical protein